MDKALIVKNNNGEWECVNTMIVDKPEKLNILNNRARRDIITLLRKKPLYPIEIAKVLGMHEQKVYYHIKQLLNLGLIEEFERKEIRGTIAKRFRASEPNYSVILEEKWKSFKEARKLENDDDKEAEKLLYPFIEEGKLNARIVVGSPDAHGTYKAYARDGHYIGELSLFLGGITKKRKIKEEFCVSLDVDIQKEHKEDENLILIGGPITNMVVNAVNSHLPVQFKEEPWGLYSKKTRKTYTNDAVGVIEIVQSPFNPSRRLLIVAGVRAIGTKSAVMALTMEKNTITKLLGQKSSQKSCVVEGFDMDGDGKIDTIEILE